MATMVSQGASLCGSDDRSFLEAMLTGDRRIKDDVYVHAQVIHPSSSSSSSSSSLRLSQKSLELCTENLGNETGSDMSDSESVEASVFSMPMPMPMSKPSLGEATKANKYAGFPPPLTTIKGKERLRLKADRQQGRLVLEAVEMLPANSIFQAERSQGRLTLCFLDESAPISGHNAVEEQEEEDVEGYGELKMSLRCQDVDRRRPLHHEDRGLSTLGDFMCGLLLNFRFLVLVAVLSAIC